MNWQAFLDTLLLALAGTIPLVVYWFKLWITERIAELKAASAVNSSRLDQHAAAITDIQQHPGLSVPPLNGPIVSVAPLSLSSVLSMTRSDPVTLSSDTAGQYAGPPPAVTQMNERLAEESASRARIGVNDPHNLGNAVIEAQAGIKS